MYGDIKEHKHPETGRDYWHPAVRKHVPGDKNIRSISICICHADGNVEEEEIDLNQAFVYDVVRAIKNGKDPVQAMLLLLNIGTRHADNDEEYRIAMNHVIGK